MYTFIACAAQASRDQMCQMRTTHAQAILPTWSRSVSSFFYRSYGRFSEDVYGCQSTHTTATQKHTERNKQTKTQTDRQLDREKQTNHTHTRTHTHTHLGGRSATCWAHLGGSHNERGTVATHTQVPTRRKQMRLHVGLTISVSKVG